MVVPRSEEAAEALRILREGLGEDLDRHRAIESRIARAIDLTQSARAKRCDNLIRPESSSDREGHACSLFRQALILDL